jgi:hypothetical protein
MYIENYQKKDRNKLKKGKRDKSYLLYNNNFFILKKSQVNYKQKIN